MITEEFTRNALQALEAEAPQRLVEIMKEAAVRYATIRAEWALSDQALRLERDAERARAHDIFIDSINRLARELTVSGYSIEWRDTLGNDRKLIGDFACYTALVLGLQSR